MLQRRSCRTALTLGRSLARDNLSSAALTAAGIHTSGARGKLDLASKYQGLEKNVWVEFIQLALDYKPLNLGQGLPDDLVPEYVIIA